VLWVAFDIGCNYSAHAFLRAAFAGPNVRHHLDYRTRPHPAVRDGISRVLVAWCQCEYDIKLLSCFKFFSSQIFWSSTRIVRARGLRRVLSSMYHLCVLPYAWGTSHVVVFCKMLCIVTLVCGVEVDVREPGWPWRPLAALSLLILHLDGSSESEDRSALCLSCGCIDYLPSTA
jgi:hypothetical protein